MNGHRKHQPAEKQMLIGNVIDMGEAINTACVCLATELTVKATDKLLYQLEGAAAGVRQFRKMLASENDPAHLRD